MGNDTLAQVAINAVEKASWAPTEDGWCQVFARLCYEHVYGDKYDSFRRNSANLTGRAFQKGGLAMSKAQAGELQLGDILYKCPSNLDYYGHVGIYVGNGKIAENSSTSIGRVRGALGYRTVSQFGNYELIVRLPPVVKNTNPVPVKPVVTAPIKVAAQSTAKLILGIKATDGKISYVHLEKATLKDNRFDVDVAELSKALSSNGINEIRPLLKVFGYSIYGEGNHLDDPVDRRKYLFIQKDEPVTPAQ